MDFRRGTFWIRLTCLSALLISHWQTAYYFTVKHPSSCMNFRKYYRLSHALHQFPCVSPPTGTYTPQTLLSHRDRWKTNVRWKFVSYVRLLQIEEEEDPETWPHSPPAGHMLTHNCVSHWMYWDKWYSIHKIYWILYYIMQYKKLYYI